MNIRIRLFLHKSIDENFCNSGVYFRNLLWYLQQYDLTYTFPVVVIMLQSLILLVPHSKQCVSRPKNTLNGFLHNLFLSHLKVGVHDFWRTLYIQSFVYPSFLIIIARQICFITDNILKSFIFSLEIPLFHFSNFPPTTFLGGREAVLFAVVAYLKKYLKHFF